MVDATCLFWLEKLNFWDHIVPLFVFTVFRGLDEKKIVNISHFLIHYFILENRLGTLDCKISYKIQNISNLIKLYIKTTDITLLRKPTTIAILINL